MDTEQYDAGYEVGLTDGRYDGYDDGYDDGQAIGYNDGYDKGYSEGESSVNDSKAYDEGWNDFLCDLRYNIGRREFKDIDLGSIIPNER